MRLTKLLIAASGGALLAGVAASADAGTLTYDSYDVLGGGVAVTVPTLSPPSQFDGSQVLAGVIQLWDGGKLVANTFCVDVYDELQGSGTYNLLAFNANNANTGFFGFGTALPGNETTWAPSLANEIGALADYGLKNIGSLTTTQLGAVQVAIWTLETGPSFGLGGALGADVSNYIADATTGGLINGWNWENDGDVHFLYDAPGVPNQTLIAVGTPEPSTWAMMALGFAGLGFAGYRGRRSSVAAEFA